MALFPCSFFSKMSIFFRFLGFFIPFYFLTFFCPMTFLFVVITNVLRFILHIFLNPKCFWPIWTKTMPPLSKPSPMSLFTLWKNIRFYNWVFQLQWTLATHDIYTVLNAIEQVAIVAMDTLCPIQYCIYGATHMQLYATYLQLFGNKMLTCHFIHLMWMDFILILCNLFTTICN
jgi:hypothetical protein